MVNSFLFLGMFWLLSQYLEMHLLLVVRDFHRWTPAARHVLETSLETQTDEAAMSSQTGGYRPPQGSCKTSLFFPLLHDTYAKR